ncbi:MAG: hypothetical protein K2J15_02245 [Muribaculaceae bacterium]|nr:hypothetical protein [Muribaculaceae bacterium]
MENKIRSRVVMLPKLMSAVLLAIAFVICGCSDSKELKADLEGMFHKIPADAAVVVSGDLKKIVEQSGGKVEDGRIVDPGQPELLKKISDDEGVRELVENIKNLSGGIEAGAFSAFMYNGKNYAIFGIRDLTELKGAVDKKFPGAWEKYNDIEFKKGFYIVDKGQQLWITGDVDLKEFEKFQELSEVGSFLSNDYSSKMASSGDAVNVWASLDGIYSTMSFSQQAQARMAVSMLFDGPKYLTGHGNFRKNGFEFEGLPMTADYSPAKCVIEVSRIDPSVVSGLGGDAYRVAAVNVSQKLVGQIKDLGKSMGGAVPAEIWNLISPLEGTMAAAVSAGEGAEVSYKGVITTNGKEDAALAQFLGSFGTVNIDGKTLTVTKGNYGNGTLNVAEVAKRMKNAWLGFAGTSEKKGEDAIVYLLLKPSEGSLKLVVDATY